MLTLQDFLQWLPRPLRLEGPFGLAWWQWIGCVVLLIAAFLLGRVVARIARAALSQIAKGSVSTWDDELLDRTNRPMRWLCSMFVARLALPLLWLEADANEVAEDILHAAIAIGFMRITIAAIGIGVDHMAKAPWAVARPASRGLLRLGGRIATVGVVVIVLIATLAGFGLPVASLLAGLGIGGIALAFGAQKTVENLFGAFSLGMDQPLREGDFVRLDDTVLGTVESIGLRSTRIRTLDRTLVSLPNGRVSEMRIETFALRDRCRLLQNIGLLYSTTSQQLRDVLTNIEAMLREHPGIWKDDVVVKLVGFGDSAITVEVQCWFTTPDWNQFRIWREEVLIRMLEIVEQAGTAIAFPSRTIYMPSGAPPALPRPTTPLPFRESKPQIATAMDDG